MDKNMNRLLEDDDPTAGYSSHGMKPIKDKTHLKIILLGTGNSGKSTVFKQFQLMHSQGGFSEVERNYYRTLMVESTIMTMRKMIQSANDLLFEGAMGDEEFDRKFVAKLQQNALEQGHNDGESMNFTEFVNTEGARGEGHANSGTGSTSKGDDSSTQPNGKSAVPVYHTNSQRPSENSERSSSSSASTGRRTDLSEHGSVHSSVHTGDVELLSQNGGSTGSINGKDPNGADRFGTSSTIISDEVAHLAEILIGLPEGTQLYEKVSVVRTFTQEGKHGNEEVSEETDQMSVADIVRIIWDEPVIQRVYAMEGKIPTLEAPIGYYMDNLDRIASKSFSPSEEDMLHARKQTRKVQELEFKVKNRKFVLIDVGGQRIERRKWINYFDEVDIILYVVGLDGFSQLCIEDGKTNRMRESLDVFRDLCDSPFFSETNIILFLNKADIFKEKIKSIPLDNCFRSFQGPKHDYDSAIKYISKRFITTHERIAQRNTAVDALPPKVYPYTTVATATENMSHIINSVQSIFLRKAMEQCGIAAM